ncbi:hypothetical protein AB0F46_29240 [Streptomyces sp. NPDC026665]|uniref:hypothetical protein n=1 Tax=Streptomyces sp. NPDC026665 TaxID=3154798 RepID=UPI00340B40DB
MNLAWVIAVLRPLDIAPHPNFRDSEYDALPPVQLAGVVSGDPSRWGHSSVQEGETEGNLDQAVAYARLSFTTEGLREGFHGLVREVESSDQDSARRCALVLLASCAAAELEEYEVIEGLIDGELSRTYSETPESYLVRAVLLQQKSLRDRDAGKAYTALTSEVLNLLDGISIQDFQEFRMSPGATVDYVAAIQDVIDSLRQAAWSLTPPVRMQGRNDEPIPSVPSWQQIVRTPKSNQGYRVNQLQSSEYARFVQISYDQMFRSQTRTFGGGGAPSLFYAALNRELMGDASVYRLRKEAALLKFLQCMNVEGIDAREVADCLRLLRHANAKPELDLAVERVRAAGPLEALKSEAVQILLNRRKPHMIRASELRILRGAADLLDRHEARDALELVCDVIRSGGARAIPGTSQLEVVRLEPAWLTAADLANSANERDQVALLLLQAARESGPEDVLLDKAVGRALNILAWEEISKETRALWDRFFSEERSGMPVSQGVFDALTRRKSRVSEGAIESLEDVANRLNAVISGDPMTNSDIGTSVEIVQDGLRRIRTDASRGLFSFQYLDPADVAAALIIFCNAADVWTPLSDFLTDPNVQRSDKSGAFDRLSSGKYRAPREVLEKFQDNSDALLNARAEHFDGDAVIPFPAALRFLASQEILSEMAAFSLISRMFGRGAPEARIEASRTVATLAASISSLWVLSQALQFSHDSEPAVRGHAARALSIYSVRSTDFGETARERLTEMMTQEAILVPLLAIRQIQQDEGFPDSAKQGIGHLGLTHPSATVRREALKLLNETG